MATPDTIHLLFVGDAMQHTAQATAALRAGGGKQYDFSDCYTFIAPDVKAADCAVVNLETPLGGGPDYKGYPCFNAPDSYAQALVDAGFDVLLTANNHCLDAGTRGARRTLMVLDSLHVAHTGTFNNAAERDSLVPLIMDVKGARIALLNYTYGTNGITAKEGFDVSLIDRQKMAREMARARQAGADFVIVLVHWGIEYKQIESEPQRALAQFLIDNGADMIIGGHPHVVQPMKVVHNDATGKDVLVVYSLGNFISNYTRMKSQGGALVRARLVREPGGAVTFLDADYDLHFTSLPRGGETAVHRVVPSWMPDKTEKSQQGIMRDFLKDARDILNSHNVNVPERHSPR